MEYEAPRLIVVGNAERLVLGTEQGGIDNPATDFNNHTPEMLLGLDD